MKKYFSTTWKSSKQPRKQRKYLANAPIHLRKKLLSVNLSKELRKKYSIRNIPVRKGDKVKIFVGTHKGKQGKITEVDYKDSRVCVEGIQVKKQDGSKSNIKLQPSNLQIIELNLEDSRRKNTLTQTSSKESNKKPEEKEVKKESTKPLKRANKAVSSNKETKK
jgi:large subunit ribosomal protein L24